MSRDIEVGTPTNKYANFPSALDLLQSGYWSKHTNGRDLSRILAANTTIQSAVQAGLHHVVLPLLELESDEELQTLVSLVDNTQVRVVHEIEFSRDNLQRLPRGLRKQSLPGSLVRLSVKESDLLSEIDVLEEFVSTIRNHLSSLPALYLRVSLDEWNAVQIVKVLSKLHFKQVEFVFPYDQNLSPGGDLKRILAFLRDVSGVRVYQLSLVPPPNFDVRLRIPHTADLLLSNSISHRPTVGVIVPLYNKCDIVEYVADAILDQTLESDQYEVIFVDDGSEDGTDQKLHKFLSKNGSGKNIKLFRLSRQFRHTRGNCYFTAGWARNVGIHNTNSSIILFLDGDMIASRNLLRNHLEVHRKKPNSICMGNRKELTRHANQYLLSALRAESKWRFELEHFVKRKEPGSVYQLLESGISWEKATEYPWLTCASCNVSVPASILANTGYFDPMATVWSLDDTDFFYRLSQTGLSFRYLNEAFAYHCWHPPEGGNIKGGSDAQFRMNCSVMFRKYLDPQILRANAYLFSEYYSHFRELGK